jgi:chemotaxis protein methyltransferase CheR
MGESETSPIGRLSEDQDFARFVADIKRSLSVDLSHYKENQMRRRLTTLRLKYGFGTFAAYYAALSSDAHLRNEFLDRMTINVSEFWRNPNRWQVLADRFLGSMAKAGALLNVWSAACSSGEEPYTLAMILDSLEALDRSSILATDIDDGVLAKAKEGLYALRSIREVPPDYLRRYFEEVQGSYRVSDRLKKAVNFKKQNLLADPFGDKYDLIICRNVMIYFTEETKALLYEKFARSLKPGGLLFVGSTEQIFSPAKYGLEPADTFFYRRLGAHV